MAESNVVHIGENSPEEVAYKLFTHISNVEKRALYPNSDKPADREWILKTYAQCIYTVRNPTYVEDALKEKW